MGRIDELMYDIVMQWIGQFRRTDIYHDPETRKIVFLLEAILQGYLKN